MSCLWLNLGQIFLHQILTSCDFLYELSVTSQRNFPDKVAKNQQSNGKEQ